MEFSPIAIVGRACLLPGAHTPEALWDAVAQGRDLTSSVPPDRWRVPVQDILGSPPEGSQAPAEDQAWCDRGGYVRGFAERFDPEGFAIPAARVRQLDALTQWTLHTAREALNEVRHRPPAERIGLIMGNLSFPSSGMSRFAEQVWLDDVPAMSEQALAELALGERHPEDRFNSGLPALRVAEALGLGGTAWALDAACASSLVAIKYAIDLLQDGRADLMLAGAVNRADDLFIHVGFCALKAMSRSGRSRPFHAEADGLLPAEGAGFVALKRLHDALQDGDEIYGIIRGLGLSNDGRGRGLLAPSTEGQVRAIQQAMKQSGLDARHLSLVECHATGTQVGDSTEIQSLVAAYGDSLRQRNEALPIGSLKSNLGHLITAAGVAGLVKVLEAMRNGLRPPSIHVDRPHPVLSQSPLRVLSELEPWDTDGDEPRRAAISAFGFGGNNAHLILEQPTLGLELPMRNVGPPPQGSVALVALGVVAGRASDRGQFEEAVLDGQGLVEGGEARTGSVGIGLGGLRFPPNDLRQALGQQTLLFKAAQEALDDVDGLPREKTGIFVGMGADAEVARYGLRWRLVEWARRWGGDSAWLEQAKAGVLPPLEAAGVLGTMPNIPANRLNSQFDLAGPSCTVSAEEASGLAALDLALRGLRARELDAAVVGAVDLSCEPVHRAAAAAVLGADRQIPGDAAVVMVLKRLADAWRDGDRVLALFRDDGAAMVDAPSFGLGAPGFQLAEHLGHPHAASGLLHLATAALCVHRRKLPPGRPWLSAAERQAVLNLVDVAGRSHQYRVDECASVPPRYRGEPFRIRIFSGADERGLLAALERDEESNQGPARLVVVAEGDDQLAERMERARRRLTNGDAAGPGVYLRDRPLGGQLALVFGGAGAAYRGMGTELLSALPQLGDRFSRRCSRFAEMFAWVLEPHGVSPTVLQKLWGASALSQIHAEMTLGLLQLKPDAVIGYSSGESNALMAMGVWQDLNELVQDSEKSGLFDRFLGGELSAVAQSWDVPQPQWKVWLIRAPVAYVQEAVAHEHRVHLAIIHTDNEVVISGDPAGCDRVIEAVGRSRAFPLDYDIAVHVPELGVVQEEWLALHRRPIHPVDGVRFYFSATAQVETIQSSEQVAQHILAQSNGTLDFRRVIEQAWNDGVRVFIEHGPQGATSRWTSEILGPERAAHALILPVDRVGGGVSPLLELVGALIAAGWSVDYQALLERLGGNESHPSDVLTPVIDFSAHRPPIEWPELPPHARQLTPPNEEPLVAQQLPDATLVQVMAPAPVLVPVLNSIAEEDTVSGAIENSLPIAASPPSKEVPSSIASDSASERTAVPIPMVAKPHRTGGATLQLLMDQVHQVQEMHEAFIGRQQQLHEHFMEMRRGMLERLMQPSSSVSKDLEIVVPTVEESIPSEPVVTADATNPIDSSEAKSVETEERSGVVHSPPVSLPDREAAVVPSTPSISSHPMTGDSPPKPRETPQQIVGLTLDRAQLEIHASGEISKIYGAPFARQDGYLRQVRMPEPPLLLADRVIGLDAEAGSMGKGTIWTETDVGSQDWYLHLNRMPAGVMIESGQADLMLISYLGIDWLNQGERVYRLLGCELTYHSDLPLKGETLRYDIHVDGHANQGPIRLFFFHYDCRTNGQLRLSVRQGQAGFFTDEELGDSAGILWTPETAEITPTPQLDPPVVELTRSEFDTQAIEAFAQGQAFECFGPGFELTETHTRTPTIRGGRMRFIDRVTELSTRGGPWSRGYLRAEQDLSSDDWFLDGHFKNDPCMPGTLMFEGCLNAMAFLMAGLGMTIERDGWRFQPVTDEPFQLRCRGQATPAARLLVTEIFVEEVIAGPIPTVYADLLCTIDGLKAFHARRVGLQLVPDWPLATCGVDLTERCPERVAQSDGFVFDYRALMASAWGRPSEAFGPMYLPFDGIRRVARLPGPPYHFMSRVTRIDGQIGDFRAGTTIELEYDIPEDAWYFGENGYPTMPFCVFLEAALQPCGWLASFVGSATTSEQDLSFRNLDGTGEMTAEVLPSSGVLTTRVTITDISKTAGMIIQNFDVACFIDGQQMYTLKTVFGFFPAAALANQVGLPTSDAQRSWLTAASDFSVDLRPGPARYCQNQPRLGATMLRMLDRVSGYWPGAGEAGLGIWRGEKDVDPSEWFFKAHFFQDPVQPGSLGIEAMLQLLQFAMIERGLAEGMNAPRFEPLQLHAPMTWKYRGQVVPKNHVITTTLEVLEERREATGSVVCIGRASLWVDGRRIYEAEPIGMRLVESPLPIEPEPAPVSQEPFISPASNGSNLWAESDPNASKTVPPSDESGIPPTELEVHPDGGWRFDPEKDPWLKGHRPSGGVSVLPMAMLLDLIAREAGTAPLSLVDFQARQWVRMDRQQRLWVEQSGEQLHLYASDGDIEELVATAKLGKTVEAPDALSSLTGPLSDDLGSNWTNSKDWRLLRSVVLGREGASANLQSRPEGIPVGVCHPALLHGMTLAIPHDQLERWDSKLGEGRIAWPVMIPKFQLFESFPVDGKVRCEVRYMGPTPTQDLPGFRVQFIVDQGAQSRVVSELELVEACFDQTWIDRLSETDHRRFVHEHQPVSGVRVSRQIQDETVLALADLNRMDWLPGTLSQIYGSEDSRTIAIKEHLAAEQKLHPRHLPQALPLTRFELDVVEESDEVRVKSRAPSVLDAHLLDPWWRSELGHEAGPIFDLLHGLTERFVDQVVLSDPDNFRTLGSRPVLFVSTHQVGSDALLLPWICSGLLESPVRMVLPDARKASWLGWLHALLKSWPVGPQPDLFRFIKMQHPSELSTFMNRLSEEVRMDSGALIIPAERAPALSSQQPVRKLSSAIVELALSLDADVIPVRCVHGLPVKPAREYLEFPFEFGRQSFFFGRSISSEVLREMPLAGRKDYVLDAIQGLGPDLEGSGPLSGDPDFAQAIQRWQDRRASKGMSVGMAGAVIREVLLAEPEPCPELIRLIEALQRDEVPEVSDPQDLWLLELGRKLAGWP